ncbi:hypothetical protein NDU88_001644 [Pleurodeles waltl]|uniref:Uncharacterized protein n=1 Tax=Pleurodeles waltl TaxID=8319 RepID=A0AAV7M055_PLEWA|nr:hypothetical protein NDU88_001644 [Pleurodeles waltl]
MGVARPSKAVMMRQMDELLEELHKSSEDNSGPPPKMCKYLTCDSKAGPRSAVGAQESTWEQKKPEAIGEDCSDQPDCILKAVQGSKAAFEAKID